MAVKVANTEITYFGPKISLGFYYQPAIYVFVMNVGNYPCYIYVFVSQFMAKTDAPSSCYMEDDEAIRRMKSRSAEQVGLAIDDN